MSRDGFQLGEQIGACHSHFAGKGVGAELRIVQMFFDDGDGTVQNILVDGIGGKHLRKSLRLLAELLLQQDAGVHQIIATGNQ